MRFEKNSKQPPGMVLGADSSAPRGAAVSAGYRAVNHPANIF